jgi:hypothetical protein
MLRNSVCLILCPMGHLEILVVQDSVGNYLGSRAKWGYFKVVTGWKALRNDCVTENYPLILVTLAKQML